MVSKEYQTSGVENNNEVPSYWTSVTIASALFGIIASVISIIVVYITINSEPTGSLFSPFQLIGILGCLAAAFGGMVATWHYASEHEVALTLGKGALIGLFTGFGITIVSTLISQLWGMVDPDMTQQMIDSMVTNFEAMNLPEEQKQQIIDSTVQSMRSDQSIVSQLLWGLPINGILNLLTGMIGAKIFGKNEDELV